MTQTMNSTQLQVRKATRADIPFIAWCNYEASSPYPGFCYWDPLLEGTGTETMAFIEAVFKADALAWGKAEDFLVIEENGRLIAGASGFAMAEHDYRPLNLSRLPLVAEALNWSELMLDNFQQAYTLIWSNPLDTTLAPSAPWIVECVAVIPEARGRGVAKHLMKALLNEGAERGYSHAGISVTDGNDVAKHVYESVGFQMYVTYGSAYFDNAFPGTIKYRIALS